MQVVEVLQQDEDEMNQTLAMALCGVAARGKPRHVL